MKAYNDYSDYRLRGGCVFCGQKDENRDHIPAKIFLDKPYPENLHVVPSCFECNNQSSKDEEYLSFFIEWLMMIDSGADYLRREKIRRIVKHKPQIEDRVLEHIRLDQEGKPYIEMEEERIKRILQKYAMAHITYELGAAQYFDPPQHISYAFVSQLSDESIAQFNEIIYDPLWPELGSRSFQRAIANEDRWIIIQNSNYRYYVHEGSGSKIVKMVFREFLYGEVTWSF